MHAPNAVNQCLTQSLYDSYRHRPRAVCLSRLYGMGSVHGESAEGTKNMKSLPLPHLEHQADLACLAYLKAGCHLVELQRNPNSTQADISTAQDLHAELSLSFGHARIEYLEAKITSHREQAKREAATGS